MDVAAPESRHAEELLNSLVSFHRSDARHGFYQAGPHAPIFDERSNHWLVTDPAQCVAVLTASEARSIPTRGARFSEAFKVELASFATLDKQMPLYLEGEEHKLARRGVAEFLAGRRREIRAWFETRLATWLEPLGRSGQVELVDMVLRPMVLDFLSEMIGADLRSLKIDLVSLLIDSSMRIDRRIEAITQVTAMKRSLAEQTGLSVDSERVNLLALMAMLGKDTLRTTCGESLRWQIEAEPGVKFSQMHFKEQPPATGVPYVERLVERALQLGTTEFLPGQRVRVYLQAFQYYDDMMQTHRYFGAGAHACPGRGVSVEFWKGIGDTLKGFDTIPRIISYEPETNNNILLGAKSFLIEISR